MPSAKPADKRYARLAKALLIPLLALPLPALEKNPTRTEQAVKGRPVEGRTRKSVKTKTERETPQVAVEFNASKAAEHPAGFSVFQLNVTSITPAVEEMIVVFSDDAYHMQETMKDYAQTLALLKRLRKKGFQCVAAPAVIKETKPSCGVLTAIEKTKQGRLPCQNKQGITDDLRFMWPRMKIKGIAKTVLMANCYLHCGLGRNLHYLRVISRACDGGKQPVFGFVDFNILAETLRASGMLEALGLEIIIPANGEGTCLAGKGSVIDYVVYIRGWGHLVHSCEVVRSVPCGTHVGVRTTFVDNAEGVFVTTLRKPKSLHAAVAFSLPTIRSTRNTRCRLGMRLADVRRMPLSNMSTTTVFLRPTTTCRSVASKRIAFLRPSSMAIGPRPPNIACLPLEASKSETYLWKTWNLS